MNVPSSGTVTWKSDSTSSRKASNSSSARSTSSISRTGGGPSDGAMARSSGPLHEEALVVELVLERVGPGAGGLAAGLGGAEVEQLAGVVPLVHGLADVDALVALQADQLAAGPARQHLGHLGLPHAGLALEEQRSAQAQGEEDGGGQALVGQVAVARRARRPPRSRLAARSSPRPA